MDAGFSIREYALKMRSIDLMKCWPFHENTNEETIKSLLPPIIVKISKSHNTNKPPKKKRSIVEILSVEEDNKGVKGKMNKKKKKYKKKVSISSVPDKEMDRDKAAGKANSAFCKELDSATHDLPSLQHLDSDKKIMTSKARNLITSNESSTLPDCGILQNYPKDKSVTPSVESSSKLQQEFCGSSVVDVNPVEVVRILDSTVVEASELLTEGISNTANQENFVGNGLKVEENDPIGTYNDQGFPPVYFKDYLEIYNEPFISNMEKHGNRRPQASSHERVINGKDKGFVAFPLNSRGELMNSSAKTDYNQMKKKSIGTSSVPSNVKESTKSVIQSSNGISNLDFDLLEINEHQFHSKKSIDKEVEMVQPSLKREKINSRMRLMGKELTVGRNGLQNFDQGLIWKDNNVIDLEKLGETNLLHPNGIIKKSQSTIPASTSWIYNSESSFTEQSFTGEYLPRPPSSCISIPSMNQHLEGKLPSFTNQSQMLSDVHEKGTEMSGFHNPFLMTGNNQWTKSSTYNISPGSMMQRILDPFLSVPNLLDQKHEHMPFYNGVVPNGNGITGAKRKHFSVENVPLKPFNRPSVGFQEEIQRSTTKSTSRVNYEGDVQRNEIAFESHPASYNSNSVMWSGYGIEKLQQRISPWMNI